MKLFVEGGGDTESLRSLCIEGFRTFLKRAGIKSLPRIVASGSRQSAYHDFCTEVKAGREAALLVDSEEFVKTSLGKPWKHLEASGCPRSN